MRNFFKNYLMAFGFITLIALFTLNTILSSGDIVYITLQFLPISFGLIHTTNLYQKYSNDKYLKVMRLHGKSKNKIKFTLFIVLITSLLIFVMIYLAIFLIIDYSGLLAAKNSFDSGGSPIWRLEGWQTTHLSGFLFGFYSIPITVIVLFSAFLNHFIKNSAIMLGINLIITIYGLLFGELMYNQYKQSQFIILILWEC